MRSFTGKALAHFKANMYKELEEVESVREKYLKLREELQDKI